MLAGHNYVSSFTEQNWWQIFRTLDYNMKQKQSHTFSTSMLFILSKFHSKLTNDKNSTYKHRVGMHKGAVPRQKRFVYCGDKKNLSLALQGMDSSFPRHPDCSLFHILPTRSFSLWRRWIILTEYFMWTFLNWRKQRKSHTMGGWVHLAHHIVNVLD